MIREKETRLIDFIKKQAKREIDVSELNFRTWQNCVEIKNTDLYHQLAQSLNPNKVLHSTLHDLFYSVRVPIHKVDQPGEFWLISLDKVKKEDFLRKYKADYQIREPNPNQK